MDSEWTRPKYAQRHRHYHGIDHIDHMLAELEEWRDKLTEDELWDLRTAIEFHDVIWYPDRTDNEERSVAYAERAGVINAHNRGNVIKGLIMATKAPFEPKTDLERLMVYIDWSHFAHDDAKLASVNLAIFREYQMHPYVEYAKHRDTFLEHAVNVPPKLLCDRFITQDHVDKLVGGITKSLELSRGYRPKIGIFVGSFNPFHDGHFETVKAAERFYDKVIIVQALSRNKISNGTPAGFPPYIQRYYEWHIFADGIEHQHSIKDIMKSVATGDADYSIVRGIRNGFDLQAEQNFMRYIRDMGVHQPIHHILSDAEHQHISSSAVRELRGLGHNLYTRVWDMSAEDVKF